jgi:hypothetical protein
LPAQTPDAVVLRIKAGQVAAHVSPMLYGLMTEEINYSYDGGLYAELVRNRSFKEDDKAPVHWELVERGGTGSMALDPGQPFNDAISTSLKLTVTQASGNRRAGIANEGFWGIPVKSDTRYRASFYAKAERGFTGPLTVANRRKQPGRYQFDYRASQNCACYRQRGWAGHQFHPHLPGLFDHRSADEGEVAGLDSLADARLRRLLYRIV